MRLDLLLAGTVALYAIFSCVGYGQSQKLTVETIRPTPKTGQLAFQPVNRKIVFSTDSTGVLSIAESNAAGRLQGRLIRPNRGHSATM